MTITRYLESEGFITRQQYFENLRTYRELTEETKALVEHPHNLFYAQFVTDEIKDLVKDRFGVQKLVTAYEVDTSFNSIPLKKWDLLGVCLMPPTRYLDKDLIKETGQGYSIATICCVLKEAARQLVEEYLDNK